MLYVVIALVVVVVLLVVGGVVMWRRQHQNNRKTNREVVNDHMNPVFNAAGFADVVSYPDQHVTTTRASAQPSQPRRFTVYDRPAGSSSTGAASYDTYTASQSAPIYESIDPPASGVYEELKSAHALVDFSPHDRQDRNGAAVVQLDSNLYVADGPNARDWEDPYALPALPSASPPALGSGEYQLFRSSGVLTSDTDV
jgi:hypothetical protein